MKNLDEIIKEYELLDNPNCPNDLEFLLAVISLQIRDIVSIGKDIKKVIRGCKINQMKSIIINDFVSLFNIKPNDDYEYFETKINCLENYYVCTSIFKNMFIEIYEQIDEENMQEMYKLNTFMIKKATSNMNYYEGQVKRLEYRDLLINYIPKGETDIEECYEFFKYKSSLNNSSVKVKTKK